MACHSLINIVRIVCLSTVWQAILMNYHDAAVAVEADIPIVRSPQLTVSKERIGRGSGFLIGEDQQYQTNKVKNSLNSLLGEIVNHHKKITAGLEKQEMQAERDSNSAGSIIRGESSSSIQYKNTSLVEEAGNVRIMKDRLRKEQEAGRSNDCVLLGAVGDRIPNSANVCTCSSPTAVDLTCEIEGTCVNEICAVSTTVQMDLNSGISITYCSDFISETGKNDNNSFEETCVSLSLNGDGSNIASCNAASYAGQLCSCDVCSDRSSLNIDCSQHNCRATTIECDEIDLDATELVIYVPLFQTPDFICSAVTPVPTRTPELLPTMQPTTQHCDLMDMLTANLPIANQFCFCESESSVMCQFHDVCDDQNLCADKVTVTISVSESNKNWLPVVEYCTDFANEYEQTCFQVTINLDRSIRDCDNVTYGGKPCVCTLCNDRSSVIIDCSAYHPGAITSSPSATYSYFYSGGGTCQRLPDEFGPMIPSFELLPTSDCALMDIMKSDVIQEVADYCVCDNQMSINCNIGSFCSAPGMDTENDDAVGVCVSSIDLTIDVSSGNTAKYCIEYADPTFNVTCIEIAINLDQTIFGCTSVTYGGEKCGCIVCDDRRSLKIDCSEHNPLATTKGCQRASSYTGLMPIIPSFKKSSSGVDGTIVDSKFFYSEDSADKEEKNDGGNLLIGCQEIFSALRDQLDNVDENCSCQEHEGEQQKVFCSIRDTCSTPIPFEHNSISTCAKHVDISIDMFLRDALTTETEITYCTTFDEQKNDHKFKETCVSITTRGTVAGEAFIVYDCTKATYGGDTCSSCNVCNEGEGLQIDCTSYFNNDNDTNKRNGSESRISTTNNNDNNSNVCQALTMNGKMDLVPNFLIYIDKKEKENNKDSSGSKRSLWSTRKSPMYPFVFNSVNHLIFGTMILFLPWY